MLALFVLHRYGKKKESEYESYGETCKVQECIIETLRYQFLMGKKR